MTYQPRFDPTHADTPANWLASDAACRQSVEQLLLQSDAVGVHLQVLLVTCADGKCAYALTLPQPSQLGEDADWSTVAGFAERSGLAFNQVFDAQAEVVCRLAGAAEAAPSATPGQKWLVGVGAAVLTFGALLSATVRRSRKG